MQITGVRRALAMVVRRSGPAPRPTRLMWGVDSAIAVVLAWYTLRSGFDRSPELFQVGPLGHIVLRPGQFDRQLFTSPGQPAQVLRMVLLGLLATLPLAARRRYPLAVLWVVLVATELLHDDISPVAALLASLVVSYTAARYSPYRHPAMASLVLAALVVARNVPSALPDIGELVASLAVVISLALAGDAIRTGRQRAEESRARLRTLEHEQAETMRRAVEQERSRIARELHDVVTHNVSVMVVQAGAARKIMASAPDQATEALLAVEASGRSAMAELRQVMGLLTPTEDPDTPDELAPQPGLDQLPGLVDRVRGTGMPVQLTVTGQVRPLPAGVDLAAYRVVQEALTNAVKHAAGGSAEVDVHYDPDRLRITVANAGGRAGQAAATGNGRGLIGLRERLAVYDGSLRAGRRPEGGYRVRAVIPLEGM